jgi:acyl-CoA thioesterase-1
MKSRRGLIGPAAGLAVIAVVLLPASASAQTTPRRYIAFGDSITFGTGDSGRTELGYPSRLEDLLNQRGSSADVTNAGLPGETTGEALSRINRVLNQTPGDVLLLMEGTNDINTQANSTGQVSNETILANLNEMANRAEARGMQVVHATLVPRLPSANYDGTNHATADLAAKIRELADAHNRRLADPFEVFFYQTTNVFTADYVGGSDKLHPNAAGYDLMAHIFGDVLTNVDSVPPVLGTFSPADGAESVPSTTTVQVDLFDFGAGLDLTATRLNINGTDVEPPISGTPRKVEIRYTPATPFVGAVVVRVRGRDLANPVHTFDRQVTQFVIAGTTFLRGDLDRDGRVDGADLLLFAPRFGARRGDPRFVATADINGDETVDGQDLAILASNFGRSSF